VMVQSELKVTWTTRQKLIGFLGQRTFHVAQSARTPSAVGNSFLGSIRWDHRRNALGSRLRLATGSQTMAHPMLLPFRSPMVIAKTLRWAGFLILLRGSPVRWKLGPTITTSTPPSTITPVACSLRHMLLSSSRKIKNCGGGSHHVNCRGLGLVCTGTHRSLHGSDAGVGLDTALTIRLRRNENLTSFNHEHLVRCLKLTPVCAVLATVWIRIRRRQFNGDQSLLVVSR
jgi:hypothetical protein